MNTNLVIARQMVGAEFLKLRKKRGTVIGAVLLAVGTVVVYFLWRAVNNSPGMEAVGGYDGFTHGLEIIGIFMGPLAGVLIGAQAGAGDTSAGMFRDLVLTGRSRLALFAARIPGALALCLLVVTAGYAALVIVTEAFAGSAPTPSVSTMLEGYGWALLVDGVVCVIAVGLASLTQSRPASIITLVGFELVASPVLLQSSSFGSARKALLDASVLKLAPALGRGAPVLAESIGLTLTVMALWLIVPTALGAWRTVRADA
jgi:ABC-type transport system involved in multi-copper enzyme maturation permease subunit